MHSCHGNACAQNKCTDIGKLIVSNETGHASGDHSRGAKVRWQEEQPGWGGARAPEAPGVRRGGQ